VRHAKLRKGRWTTGRGSVTLPLRKCFTVSSRLFLFRTDTSLASEIPGRPSFSDSTEKSRRPVRGKLVNKFFAPALAYSEKKIYICPHIIKAKETFDPLTMIKPSEKYHMKHARAIFENACIDVFARLSSSERREDFHT